MQLRSLHFGEITGSVEQAVAGTDTEAVIRLLDRIVLRGSRGAPPDWSAAELTTFERDRLSARLYRDLFGDRIESTIRCRNCEKIFEISFSLQSLDATLAPQLSDDVEVDKDGAFRTPDGSRFRLPTGADEIAVAGLDADAAAEALRARCLLEGSGEGIEEAMNRIAPIFHLELQARCAECGVGQAIEFDLQSFLLESLRAERRTLVAEAHRIASAYGWSLAEILSLTRSQRKGFVEWIELERRAGRRAGQ